MRSTPGRDRRDTGRSRRLAVVEHDALPEAAERPGPGTAADLGEILLLDAEPRVSEQLRELAVVGEKKQTFGLLVEAPDREDPRSRSGTRSSTVGRPCGSSAVVTTPAGLFSR